MTETRRDAGDAPVSGDPNRSSSSNGNPVFLTIYLTTSAVGVVLMVLTTISGRLSPAQIPFFTLVTCVGLYCLYKLIPR